MNHEPTEPSNYWRSACSCGFKAKSPDEWQRHGIVYQGCGKGRSPFQHQRGKRKPNVADQATARRKL